LLPAAAHGRENRLTQAQLTILESEVQPQPGNKLKPLTNVDFCVTTDQPPQSTTLVLVVAPRQSSEATLDRFRPNSWCDNKASF